eukprot:365576-Chlamydomonas_euryale.AAC.14
MHANSAVAWPSRAADLPARDAADSSSQSLMARPAAQPRRAARTAPRRPSPRVPGRRACRHTATYARPAAPSPRPAPHLGTVNHGSQIAHARTVHELRRLLRLRRSGSQSGTPGRGATIFSPASSRSVRGVACRRRQSPGGAGRSSPQRPWSAAPRPFQG